MKPTNISVGNEVNPTNSRGKNVIDHIWVKASLRDRFNFNAEIYDGFGDADSNLLYGGVSDHKPVILSIQMKEPSRAPVVALLPLSAKRTRRGGK